MDSYKVKAKKTVSESVDDEWNGCLKVTQCNMSSGWYSDSGIMSHVTSNQEAFLELDLSTKEIFLKEGKSITAEGIWYGFLHCYEPSKRTQTLCGK